MRPFFELLPKDKDIVGVEVGVHSGDNALDVLTDLPKVFLNLVDPYTAYDDPDRYVSTEYIEDKEEKAHNKLHSFTNTKWIKKYSVDAAKDFEDNSLDFVYIDGNHATDFVMEDIKSWLPKIKPGGLLGGDDYTKVEVKKAVDECATSLNKTLVIGERDWWFE